MPAYRPPLHAYQPPDLADSEVYALKNLAAGNANEGQQQLAMATIIRKFAGYYDMSFRPGPDGARETDLHEGRRFVGSRIMEAVQRPMKPQGGLDDGTRPEEGPAAKGRRNRKPARPKAPAPE